MSSNMSGVTIKPTLCANLVNSMPRRVASVITNDGGHTKY